MTLPIPTTVNDPRTQQALDAISNSFPLKGGQIGKEAVGSLQLGKASVTDEKLASPVIRGQVKANGEKALGTGFSCEKTSAGNYKITLTNELATEGIMTLTGITSGFHAALIVTATGKKIFTVGNWNNALAQEDTPFNFMVMAS